MAEVEWNLTRCASTFLREEQNPVSERCGALLADVESLKVKFQRYKDTLVTLQNKENVNFSTCINIIKENEEELISKIKERTGKIVQSSP